MPTDSVPPQKHIKAFRSSQVKPIMATTCHNHPQLHNPSVKLLASLASRPFQSSCSSAKAPETPSDPSGRSWFHLATGISLSGSAESLLKWPGSSSGGDQSFSLPRRRMKMVDVHILGQKYWKARFYLWIILGHYKYVLETDCCGFCCH